MRFRPPPPKNFMLNVSPTREYLLIFYFRGLKNHNASAQYFYLY